MSGTQNQGRVAVVTGASSGIGAATARALAADGYRIALLARRTDRIAALAKELDNGSIAIEADVTDRAAIVAAAERVQQDLGGADVLVNNAGVMLLSSLPPASTSRAQEPEVAAHPGLVGDDRGVLGVGLAFAGLLIARLAATGSTPPPLAGLKRRSRHDRVKCAAGVDVAV